MTFLSSLVSLRQKKFCLPADWVTMRWTDDIFALKKKDETETLERILRTRNALSRLELLRALC